MSNLDPALKSRLEQLVNQAPIMLFMKGTPDSPMCGFSARAVQILNHAGAQFQSFNIFEDEEVRQGLKELSQWPTFPQLYVKGQLVGGCDIMTEMYQSGELHDLLGIKLENAQG